MPVAVADIGAAEHAHVDSVYLGMIAATGFPGFRASLETVACRLKLAEMERDHARKMVSLSQKRGGARPVRQCDRLVASARGPAQVPTHMIDVAEPPRR